MAEKETKTKSEHKGGGKSKTKKRLRAITTHKADDGSFVHEHHYQDEAGQNMPPTYGGVSANLDDLQQHMADHFGAGDETGAEQGAGGAGSDAEPPGGMTPAQ